MSPPWPGRRPRPAPIWSPSSAASARVGGSPAPDRSPADARVGHPEDGLRRRRRARSPRGGASACWRISAARLPAAAVVPVDTGASGGRALGLAARSGPRTRSSPAATGSSPPFAACPRIASASSSRGSPSRRSRAATAASGLTGDQFRFGGGWGAAEGALARLLRPGADGASYLADHFGTLAPLLALDSALDELPRLLAESARPRPGPTAGARGRASGRAAAEPGGAARRLRCRTLPRASVDRRQLERPGASRPVPVVARRQRLSRRSAGGRLSSTTARPTARSSGSRASIPAVRVVALASNQGFTGGNAAGVAVATGDVLVFFNNDMRVEPDAVRRLVDRRRRRHGLRRRPRPQLGRPRDRLPPRHDQLRGARLPGLLRRAGRRSTAPAPPTRSSRTAAPSR